jgi:hypothetical protein
VHYVAHWTNLVVIVLSKLPLASHIETYAFFAHNLEKYLKFSKIAKFLLLKVKNYSKMWRHIKSICYLPSKMCYVRIQVSQYEMHLDSTKNKVVQDNLVFLWWPWIDF